MTRPAVAPKALKIGLFARGSKVRFGVVGNHKIRASSRPWAGGHACMPKPRYQVCIARARAPIRREVQVVATDTDTHVELSAI